MFFFDLGTIRELVASALFGRLIDVLNEFLFAMFSGLSGGLL